MRRLPALTSRAGIVSFALALAITLAEGACRSAPADPVSQPLRGLIGKSFYVAPFGNDGWSGRLPVPEPDESDGPFATLAAARAAMAASAKGTRTTLIRGGDYYLPSGLDLTSEDSGQSYLAYPGENPILHGGLPVTGWSRQEDGIWKAKAPLGAFPQHTGATRDLFVNRRREIHARYPDYVPSDPVRGGWLFAEASLPTQDPHTSFRFKPGDLPHLDDVSDLWVSIFSQNGWENQVKPVANIDYVNGIVELGGPVWWESMGLGSRYFFFNAADQLTAAGEWHYDQLPNMMRYLADEDWSGARAVIGTAEHIMRIKGASDVTIAGLTFTASATSGRALWLEGTMNVTLAGNTIENALDGIYLRGANRTIEIHGNEIRAMHFSGINVDTGSSDVRISGNWIHDIGHRLKGGAGIWFHGLSKSEIANNLIEHTAKFGIGGGSLGIGNDASYRVTIEYNQIRDANREASDGGGVMISGRQRDLMDFVIRHNDISNTTAAGTVSWDGTAGSTFLDPERKLISFAIYLDEFASGVEVHGNLLHDNIGGMLVHGGWSNTFSNNIVANSSGIATCAYDPAKGGASMSRNKFLRTVVYLGRRTSAAASTENTITGAMWDENLYTGPALGSSSFLIKVKGLPYFNDLADWQTYGFDAHSRVADPMFVDAGNGNYHLAPHSGALAMGFEDLPIEQMGLRGYRATLPYDLFGRW